MRVLEVTGEPILHGGQEKFIANLIENMNDPDIIMDVLTPYQVDNDNFCQLVSAKGGNVYNLGFVFAPGKSRREIIAPIISHIKKNSYDVVHVHSGSISVLSYVAYAAKKAGAKKVLVHAHNTGTPSLKHEIVKLLNAKRFLDNVDYYLACSYEAGATKYPRKVVNSRMIIIKNAVNTREYQRDPEKRMQCRQRLGLSEEDRLIGHVGRFSEEKNQGYLLDLFDNIRETDKNAYLILIGDGEKRDEIEERIKKSTAPDHIILTGNVDNVQDYYQAMDLFLLPSIHEGLPFVLVEAQAAGLPCIMSTGVTEKAVICDKVVRIPLEKFEDWVSAAKTLLEAGAQDNTAKIKAAGYDISNMVQQIRDLYYR